MANQFLSLGLFIIMLAFFLVLNSMSKFDATKAEVAINSVHKSFMTSALPAEIEQYANNLSFRESESFRAGDALDNVQALFHSTIPDAKASKNRFGSILTVQVNKTAFEKALQGKTNTPEGAQPRQDEFKERFTAMLAAMLDTQVSVPYTMDILLNIAQEPAALQKQDAAAASQALKTVSGYAQILQEQGVDSKLISPGLYKGESETVTLVFTRYEPINLRVREKRVQQ